MAETKSDKFPALHDLASALENAIHIHPAMAVKWLKGLSCLPSVTCRANSGSGCFVLKRSTMKFSRSTPRATSFTGPLALKISWVGLCLRFSPTPTARDGITGQQVVQSKRSSSYEAEISLSGEYQTLHILSMRLRRHKPRGISAASLKRF
jgi:hypothetical protein